MHEKVACMSRQFYDYTIVGVKKIGNRSPIYSDKVF